MAKWDVNIETQGEYEIEQAERMAVFNKIAPKSNWKGPISAWIKTRDFDECNQAAIWFTGSELTIVATALGMVRVEAPGYYTTIGA